MAESSVKPVYQERLIDFAVQNIVVGDAASMLAVPDNTLVMNCNYQTLATVTSASSSFAIIGNTASVTYVAATTAVAAGAFGVPNTISAATAQTWYPAKDDIQIKTVTVADLTVGKIKVFALMLFPQPYQYVDVDGNTKAYTFTDRNNWTATAPTIP